MKKTTIRKRPNLVLDKEVLRRLVLGGDGAPVPVTDGPGSNVISTCPTLCSRPIDTCA